MSRELWVAVLLLRRDPTIGRMEERSSPSFCPTGSLEQVALQNGDIFKRNPLFSVPSSQATGGLEAGAAGKKLCPDSSCP